MDSLKNIKISKRTVDAIKPPNKEIFVWDSQLNGFGLRVQPTGVKTYIVQYRIGGRGSRQRRYTIGKHGSPWSPDSARNRAEQILGDVAHGKDPSGSKQTLREGATVKLLAYKFLEEHADSKRKPSTAKEYRRLIEKHIIPELGMLRVIEVNRSDIAKFHNSNKEYPYQANRCLAILSKMFNLAEEWGERTEQTNPCLRIEKYTEHKRERFLSEKELADLSSALIAAEKGRIAIHKKKTGKDTGRKYKFSSYAIAAIRLLIFTGARLREITTLKWDYIDLKRAEARLPDSKTGAKTIYFPPPAMEILSELKRVKNNPYVIVGTKKNSCLVNLEKPWLFIRKEAGLEGLRLHDLRHGFASVAASSGMGLPIIGKILGHTQPQTTARYAHLSSDPVKAAASSVAKKIARAMSAGQK